MNVQEILVAALGGSGLVGVITAALRSKRLRPIMIRILTGDIDLKEAVDSLRLVVNAQGESIEWLRNELSRARTELDEARTTLKATEKLAKENAKLRARVVELEAHVARLEGLLNKKESK